MRRTVNGERKLGHSSVEELCTQLYGSPHFRAQQGGVMETVEERELTVPENLVKVILGATLAYLARHYVEKSVESGFRKYRN
jgi:hypothetical protein